MRIDDVSKSLNITKAQIRYYEKVGLLKIPRDANQYHVLKYPLNLSGIYTISTYHIDNLNRSRNKNKTMDKMIVDITKKVMKKLEE